MPITATTEVQGLTFHFALLFNTDWKMLHIRSGLAVPVQILHLVRKDTLLFVQTDEKTRSNNPYVQYDKNVGT